LRNINVALRARRHGCGGTFQGSHNYGIWFEIFEVNNKFSLDISKDYRYYILLDNLFRNFLNSLEKSGKCDVSLIS
jgi:hypothetical protein